MNSIGKLYYRLVIPPSAPTAARNNESPTPLGNSTKSPLMCGNRVPRLAIPAVTQRSATKSPAPRLVIPPRAR